MMAVDRERNLWLHWGASTLGRLDPAGPVKYQLDRYEPLLSVQTLYAGLEGPLMTGPRAIGQLRDGKVLMAEGKRLGHLRGASGLVQTPKGETWAAGAAGVMRLATADLERAFRDPAFAPPLRLFDFYDGLPDRVMGQLGKSLVAGGDGRVWVATAAGTAWIDPARLHVNAMPPPVAITALVAGGTRLRDPSAARLRAGLGELSIRFSAPSLTMPERVRVRYRLEGYDNHWVDPGRRREAFYTNLPPGTYRFRVIAANEDGIWNREGASLSITIPATFLQSVWFKLLIAVLAFGVLALAVRLRIRQVTARLQTQFDVRIAERERIARELHDTLLQGFQGLVLRFQAVTNRLPADHGLRGSLDDALDRADAVLVEGRARVRDLRPGRAERDLGAALGTIVAGFAEEGGPRIELAVDSLPRPLHPLVHDELHRIAEEAIRNAAAHAEARLIAVSLAFNSRELRLSIRDDGRGLPPEVSERGARSGHFGLTGMRERATRIGGRLELTTRPGEGTEVLVNLPARAAFGGHQRGVLMRLWELVVGRPS